MIHKVSKRMEKFEDNSDNNHIGTESLKGEGAKEGSRPRGCSGSCRVRRQKPCYKVCFEERATFEGCQEACCRTSQHIKSDQIRQGKRNKVDLESQKNGVPLLPQFWLYMFILFLGVEMRVATSIF